MTISPSPIELLELDIDLRMPALWADVREVDEWTDDVVLALMRAAYGQGSADALSEERPGALCRDHRDVHDLATEPVARRGLPGRLRRESRRRPG
jgi:hypothetical protein